MEKEQENIFQRIPAPLLSWYQENKRTLPWRENVTAYKVWVSEIMLQQTRVEAVKEYFVRFMSALPNIKALAECEEEKLLKLWEGLGYYSRVRNLQKAAKRVLFEYGGELPENVEELKSLPGIGEYTAGAIASIAYGQKVAAVDGNVFRVASRLEENPTPISSPAYLKYLQTELSKVYPNTAKGCSDFTQSLFELGALICKPVSPECEKCPLKSLCKAYRHGTQRNYPVLPIKREKRIEEVYVFLIKTPQGYCIRRREEGVLRGMNEFPSHVVLDGETPQEVLNEWGMSAFTEKKRKPYVHIFTHIRWNMTCILLETESAPFDAYTLEEIKETISLPTAFRQCLGMIENEEI